MKALEAQPASALLLPAHTVFASQIQPGDHLAICEPDELESMLELLSSQSGVDPVAQEIESPEEKRSGTHNSPRSTPGHHRLPQQHASRQPNASEAELGVGKKSSLGARIKHWFFGEAQSSERSIRRALPGLIAYHWSGGTPQAYHLGNISETGFYLLTDERPYPGTLILMTLQRTDSAREKLEDTIAVYTKVIRWGPDGVGFAFVPLNARDKRNTDRQPDNWADQKSLQEFLKALHLP